MANISYVLYKEEKPDNRFDKIYKKMVELEASRL